ncbi:protein fosB isoform X1 [Polypterus senegalus]|uniref:protein fosB isoform X1 n=1 Tax=Polypterus senegalus TaxID=55291 RepID=UPI001963186C|nr:protein fosB isoform X1 [Polypterus senegalus]
MYQGFPGDFDSGSRGSSSPSAESQYLSSVDSFGSPPATTTAQECTAATLEMPGSFVPTVTAITTSQDLQWMVQPTLISSVAQSQPSAPPTMSHQAPLDPYDLPGTSYSTPGGSYPTPTAETPGPSRPTRTRTRRPRDETLTPEEEERRRVRRERNKLAAAKCRNRRRELTDRLQSETDQLEEEKAELEAEIAELQKEKDRLEFVLVAHQPACKIPFEEDPQQQEQQQVRPSVSILGLAVKEDPFYLASASVPAVYPPHPQSQQQPGLMSDPGAEVDFSSSFFAHTEPVMSAPYPANSSYTSSFVFTYPEGSSTCGASAHHRNSSSEQSSDSLSSPSLLAL